jgi:hypothetical protein
VFIGPRRAILIGAIAAVALTIILVPLIFTINQPDFSKVEVRLSNVTIVNAEEKRIELKPVFMVTNPTDETITTGRIEYELLADGVSIGTKFISYEDVPLNGRPAIFSKNSVPISDPASPLVLELSDKNAGIFAKIHDNPGSVKWSATGTAEIDSTLVQYEKTFGNGL